jgi:hypothetical protein
LHWRLPVYTFVQILLGFVLGFEMRLVGMAWHKNQNNNMKKHIILGLLSLALTAATALGGTLNTVLVTTNQLVIPYTGTYAANRLVKLGNYTLPWTQAGKSSNIVATLPTNIPAGTYALALQGSTTVSVEIGSVTAAAALNARVNAETARAGNAEASLTNDINAEVTRATAAEAGLTNGINAEITRATGAETDLANSINSNSNSINATSNNIIANFTSKLNSTSNGVSAVVASNINTASNNIVVGLVSDINAASNSIVVNLTKNFTTAYAFGPHTASAHASIAFTSFIGNWTTNGTTFKIPATGVYQISFVINADRNQLGIFYYNQIPAYFDGAIQITVVNATNTNGLGYFHYGPAPVNTFSGQTTAQCFQGDLISIDDVSRSDGYDPIAAAYYDGSISYGSDTPTNIPSATLSIIQIQ